MTKRQKKKRYRRRLLEECNGSYAKYCIRYIMPLEKAKEEKQKELAELKRLK